MRVIALLTPLLTILTFLPAAGQNAKNNEVGLLLGWEVAPDRTVTGSPGTAKVAVGTALTYQATYARRLSGGNTAFFFEVPFVATPSRDVTSPIAAVPRNYASLFVTPGVRVEFGSQSAVSPWLSLGAGYGRYDESSTLLDGTANTGARGTNSGAVQFGAGVDFRTPVRLRFPIGLRAEVRDFYAGAPRLNLTTDGNRQHNIIFSAGIVLHF